MLRRERKAAKKERIAMKRYVALRMTEDIEESVARVSGKARRMARAARSRRQQRSEADEQT